MTYIMTQSVRYMIDREQKALDQFASAVAKGEVAQAIQWDSRAAIIAEEKLSVLRRLASLLEGGEDPREFLTSAREGLARYQPNFDPTFTSTSLAATYKSAAIYVAYDEVISMCDGFLEDLNNQHDS